MLSILLPMAFIVSLLFFLLAKKQQGRFKILHYLRKISAVACVFFACIITRVFIFEIYYIPSGSMENSLIKGDYVFVSKLNYGARIPQELGEIPWLNLFSDGKQPQAPDLFSKKRSIGFGEIKTNDILIFNYPGSTEEYYVKRCVGLPGVCINFVNDKVLIDHKPVVNKPTVKIEYTLTVSNGLSFPAITDSLHIPYSENWYERKNTRKTICLSDKQKSQLTKVTGITFLKTKSTDDRSNRQIGGTLIPKCGMNVLIDSAFSRNYSDLISKYETINPNYSKKYYRFLQNYYFVMGDNRNYSIDSRTWGLLPANYIVGKPLFVLFSYTKTDGFKWNRTLKWID